jgi:transcription antitermination factor NusG
MLTQFVRLTDVATGKPVPTLAVPPRWFAVLVQSGAELRCWHWFRRRGIDPYWPCYRTQPRQRGRQARFRAVIPGYLFLPLPAFISWTDVRRYNSAFRGVLSDADGEFIELPDRDVTRIRDIELALRSSPIAAAQGIPFKVGQQVMISRLDLEGTIIRIDSSRHIEVEAKHLFGRVVRIHLPVSEIDAV